MKEGVLLWDTLLQWQTFPSFISGESLQAWEIFLPLTEETSWMIKMQQYIDQNHLSKWKQVTPCHYVKHRAIQDFCVILCLNRVGHTKRPWGLDDVAVPAARPAPGAGTPISFCAREEGADKPHRGGWAQTLTHSISLCGCRAQQTCSVTAAEPSDSPT